MTNSLNIENDPSNSTLESNNEFSHRIIGNQVIVRQGGAQSMEADHLTIRQGGAMNVKATRLDMTQGGIIYAHTDAASLTSSHAGGIVAGGDMHIDQSIGQVLLVKGSVQLDQSAVGILVANEVKVERTTSIFLIAKRIEGDLTTLFGPREALIFGAVSGLVMGIFTWLIKTAKQRRKGR
jgi:hypothetical protein